MGDQNTSRIEAEHAAMLALQEPVALTLLAVRDALLTLPEDALGMSQSGGAEWPVRDELLSGLESVLKQQRDLKKLSLRLADELGSDNDDTAQRHRQNRVMARAMIMVHKHRDSEPEPLLSYLCRAIYWDLRGTDDFDVTKAGPDKDGLRDRAKSITESTLRRLLFEHEAVLTAAQQSKEQTSGDTEDE